MFDMGKNFAKIDLLNNFQVSRSMYVLVEMHATSRGLRWLRKAILL